MVLSFNGSNDFTIQNIVKFGAGMTFHHNKTMPQEFLSIGIISCLLLGVTLPFLEVDTLILHFVL
jgi:hypothetical protein